MNKRRKSLSETEIRTIVAVFGELYSMPYSKLNTFLGSITIEEMTELYAKLRFWYRNEKDADDEM